MQISSGVILLIIISYFLVLLGISYFTTRKADSQSFYLGNRKSPWLVVAFGMIGASLSGVTFISVPGAVGDGGSNMAFSYMQMVFGYLVGYLIIATVLMPIYYRMNLTSIYGFLEDRFGPVSYKIGAAYFLLSRVIGASLRLYLVSIVLDQFVLGPLGIPFLLTVIISILLIWSYTFIGGIKTIIWTDTMQTLFMLLSVILTIVFICNALDISFANIGTSIKESGLGQMFFFENGWSDPNNFYKQFISGALLALVMTGLDQDMMQKNLSCKSLKDAQKNMFVFSIILIFANLLFLSLGALLYMYANQMGIIIPEKSDQLYPTLALQHFSPMIGVFFILGLIAAAYSSADSALTALTTSFSVDILDIEKKNLSDAQKKRTRLIVHVGFSLLLVVVIVVFNALNDGAVINKVFIAANYTYGPLLGLYTFGVLHKRLVLDPWVIIVCIASPILSYIINMYSGVWFNGFSFGFLILALNGFITYLGLWILSLIHDQQNNRASIKS